MKNRVKCPNVFFSRRNELKNFLLLILVLIFQACSTTDEEKLLNRNAGICINLMTSSSSFHLVTYEIIDGIEYRVGASSLEKKYIYIDTQDLNFITPRGFRVGNHFNEIVNDLQQDLFIERGWYAHVKLNSGWNAAFLLDTSFTKMKLDSEIVMFYKRDCSFPSLSDCTNKVTTEDSLLKQLFSGNTDKALEQNSDSIFFQLKND